MNIFRFKHVNNKYNVHGLISWDKAHAIGLDFVGDYISTHYFWCRYSLSVSSSVESLPNVNLTLNHLQNATNLETNIYVKVSRLCKNVYEVNNMCDLPCA